MGRGYATPAGTTTSSLTITFVNPTGDDVVVNGASMAGFGAAPRATGSLIVVATDRRTAVALAAAGAQPGLGVVLR